MKKPNYFYKQSAVIPYRIKEGNLQVLLITTRKRKRWIIPKGIVEPNLTPQESALKEAIEEAGVKGKVSNDIFGTYEFVKWGNTCEVKVYLMKVDKQLDKWIEDFRDRKWVDISKAVEMIDNTDLTKLVKRLSNHLNIKN
jgi:8-oxo-dGTP pyrophosphatase MutT (NUDIX family)